MESENQWLKESFSELKADMKSGFNEVRRDLTEIKTQVAVLETDMKNMGTNQIQEATERKQIEKRVSDLESFKTKLVGIQIGASAVFAFLAGIILKLIGL